MRNNEANIFVFAACIIIGVLISMNISIGKGRSYVFLSSEQYQDAYNHKIQLHNEISSLINQYDSYEAKLIEYKADDKNNNSIDEEVKKELKENNMILGKTAVSGQGVIIVLNDADSDLFNNTIEDEFRLVHNTDMIQVINDLKNGGAEAISINGQRLIGSSEVYCSGPFLRVNSVKIAAPFTINAIGNKQVLYDFMMSDENCLKSLMLRKLNVQISLSDNINIPACIVNEKLDYIKAVN